jgi:hypothetical protein
MCWGHVDPVRLINATDPRGKRTLSNGGATPSHVVDLRRHYEPRAALLTNIEGQLVPC